MNTFSQVPILVTGASGQLGRAVVAELLGRGAGRVVAGSRTPDKLSDLAAQGVETRVVDFDRPDTLRAAFAGVERLALISSDSIEEPGRRLAQHRAAVAAAVAGGVRHVVYTSAPSPYPAAEGSLNDDHFWTEAALFAAPCEWTILRNHLYAELLLMNMQQATKSGRLFSATAGGGRAYVTRADCARAVVGALLDARGREVLDVTGPEAVTQEQVAALFSELTGQSVAHVEVPPAGLREGLTQAGLPPALVKALVEFDVAAAQGYHALVTPTVERLTGRRPVAVRAFLEESLRGADAR